MRGEGEEYDIAHGRVRWLLAFGMGGGGGACSFLFYSFLQELLCL